VIGYSSASSIPALVLTIVGPKLRERSDKAFSTSDFGRERYGRLMQTVIGIISGFYMFIFIVAELTSISNIFALLTNQSDSTRYRVTITLVIAFSTMFYTALAGLPASIITDKFQGIMVIGLVLLLTLTLTTRPENHVSRAEFDRASNITGEGAIAWGTLVLAIMSAEMFNQCSWQRVWAARDVNVMRKGFMIGSGMIFLLMMFFGVVGMLGKWWTSGLLVGSM
jgi:solute:Na+ symporter, SSS family